MKKLTHQQASQAYTSYCNLLQQGTNPMTFEQFCKIEGIIIVAN